jgi:hypothetical protein
MMTPAHRESRAIFICRFSPNLGKSKKPEGAYPPPGNRPYRAIGPPLALLLEFISHFQQTKHHPLSKLYVVLKQVLVKSEEVSTGPMDCFNDS